MSKFTKYLVEMTDETEKTILNFFKEHPNAQDPMVHAFAEELKIDTHEFEGFIYNILGSFLGAGRAYEKDKKIKDVDKKQLKMGTLVEMEHTNNPLLAQRIAMDHLAEIPDYYTRLAKMEKAAGIEHD